MNIVSGTVLSESCSAFAIAAISPLTFVAGPSTRMDSVRVCPSSVIVKVPAPVQGIPSTGLQLPSVHTCVPGL